MTANHTESAIQYELTDGEGVVTVAEGGAVTILKAGTATIRAFLPESKNYNAAEKTITVKIEKKLLYSITTGKAFYYDRDEDAALNVRAFLPEDCGKAEVDRVIDAHEKVLINQDAYDDTTGILPYRILKNDMGASATVKIRVASENYMAVDIVLTVTWNSKLDVYVKEGQTVALKNDIMTYGDRLSALEFEPVAFVDAEGNTVEGTLAWEDGARVPVCSVQGVTWKFTPEDDKYAVLTDFIKITVNQAKPNVDSEPKLERKDIVYGPAQTLAGLELSGGSLSWTVDGREQEVSGSWT